MMKRSKILVSVFSLAIMGMSNSASAEDIDIGTFRNIVTGVNGNVATTNIIANNLKTQKQLGWVNDVSGNWYYLNELGERQTGWLDDGGTWYYFDQSGIMLHDININGYYLNSLGKWEK